MSKIKPFAELDKFSSAPCIRIPHHIVFGTQNDEEHTMAIIRAINIAFIERIKRFKKSPRQGKGESKGEGGGE